VVKGSIRILVIVLGLFPEHPKEGLVLVFLSEWLPKFIVDARPYLWRKPGILLGVGESVPVFLNGLECGTLLHLLNLLESIDTFLELRVCEIELSFLHVLDVDVLDFVVDLLGGEVLEALVNLVDCDDVGVFGQLYFLILKVDVLLLLLHVDGDQLAFWDYHLFLCGLQSDRDFGSSLCRGVAHH